MKGLRSPDVVAVRGSLSAPSRAHPSDGGKAPEDRRTPKPRGLRMSGSQPVILIQGAREHNLKDLSAVIPRDRFVVITGVSGSGKSTLAFDLLFAEGQRRFLDSMNTYARQFVDQLSRPDVDLIAGLPPTVSIEQRTTRGGGKSTVATVTEVHHFLRLLFARLGTTYCPDCQVVVEAQTRDRLGGRLLAETDQRGDLLLLAPMVKNRKGFHSDVADWAAKHGYAQLRADGKLHATDQPFRLDRYREHDVEIVVGVLERERPSSGSRRRTSGAAGRAEFAAAGARRVRRAPEGPTPQQLIDETLELGQGALYALDGRGQLTVHSTHRACPQCGRSYPPLDPKNFSYNSAQGWCPRCRGFGELFYLPDVDRGARADAIEESWWGWMEGEREVCPDCHGARLNPLARAVRLLAGPGSNPPTIETFGAMSVGEARHWFSAVRFSGRAALVARDVAPEILARLAFLEEVGLGYLQLGRAVTTLSGGEAQRIRLAAQLGSNLSGVLYILDEPTIGLHARDNEQLLAALDALKARGNSVVVVEHDETTMRHADHIIDLGPGAGLHGGRVVASGTLRELLRHKDSITGQALRAKKSFPARGFRRPVRLAGTDGELVTNRRAGVERGGQDARPPVDRQDACPTLVLRKAAVHNLKDITARFPLQRFVVVTGVSGSGKSTLVRECLMPALADALASRRRTGRGPAPARPRCPIAGWESIQAVHEVDQSPIGRTPRSTPATYVGFFDEIRKLFAQTPEARMRGYGPGRFSFNSALGRCPECEGAGVIKLEMNFLPPAFVRCETCTGTRYDRETLEIEYRGRNIAQVLDLSVEEAIGFFGAFPRLTRALEALRSTGLDYLKLGQTSPTLSGGEAQRVKLVSHLLSGLARPTEPEIPRPGRSARGNLFILEEPTIGLHIADVTRLVQVLQRLVEAGHSVIVIEHNLDLIAEADWVIDLGPDAGDEGGRVVAEGTPEQISRHPRSQTGRYLRGLLSRR
jgi:excinuclease ABC subunit A